MVDSILFRVEIDNEDAKKALAELQEGASNIGGEGGGRVSGMSDRIGMVMRGVGIALGASAAWSLTGPLASGTNDVISESLGRFGEDAKRAVLGESAMMANASDRARQQVREIFGLAAGARGGYDQAAVDFYEGRKKMNMYEEHGRSMAASDPRFRATDDMIEDAVKRIEAAVEKVPDGVLEGLFGASGALYRMFK